MTSAGSKTVLVTGASRGLGAAIAKAMAAAGWAVAVNYSKDDAGATAVVDQIQALGGRAAKFRFDIREQGDREDGVRAICSMLGPLTAIVNNATGPQPELAFGEQTWGHYSEQLDFALKAPFELLQLVLPEWRVRGGGVVVNIGSEVVDLGNANAGHYVAAKGALLAATRSWARELAEHNIRINIVSPGWIPVERHVAVTPERKKRYLDQVPMKHFGRPEDIADAVVFLASDQARFITGQRITVNGGRTFS